MADIKSDNIKLNLGSPLVELFTIDATGLGAGTYHFTPMTSGGGKVVFNSVQYSPLPIETEGFEWEGDGKMPRPLIRVSNINLTFVAAVTSYYDLVGAKLTRRRTYAKYLDNGSSPNGNAQFPLDVFYIERKTRQNKQLIEWELKAAVDVENIMVPRRQAIDICNHRYRIYDSDTGDFDYSRATCPYTDTPSFDIEGNPVSKANDKCGRRLFDCQLRYTKDSDQLPFRGFPGIGQIGYPYR